MRIVALEEHATIPAFQTELEQLAPDVPGARSGERHKALLDDIEGKRLASMDATGITVQVLSIPGTGAALLQPDVGPGYTRRYNDALNEVVKRHPGRFEAFAHLPLTNGEACAAELERTVREHGAKGALVSGSTNGLFLDDPSFEPLLAKAEALGVPIYVHPGVPPLDVQKAYYAGFKPEVSGMFATTGWGWHAETAVHILRLVLSGQLDRHPKLKLIVGHMGEGLPTMLARCDQFMPKTRTGLQREVSETILDHVAITTAGFFTFPPFIAALLTFGADRILFSVDYPFSDNVEATRFLESLPIAPADKEKIAHGNADRLLNLSK